MVEPRNLLLFHIYDIGNGVIDFEVSHRISRRYCTARLRRLYKSLKFTHGRGKYTKRAITASIVIEVR